MTEIGRGRDRPTSASAWSATPSWARSHSQAWRTAGRFFDLPCAPAMTALCGRDAGGGRSGRRADGLGVGRDRLAAARRARRHRRWSTSARPATATPRSPSPRSRPASTCCARSRWPTRSRRPRRWSTRGRRRARRAACGRWWASTTGGCRRSRWPGELVADGPARHHPARPRPVPAGLDRRPEFPLVWRLQKDRAGSGALGDIGAHIIDLAQFVTGSTDHRGVRR